jgi:NADP-dependent 3-hydroxy acid dehydrogenase YdfG
MVITFINTITTITVIITLSSLLSSLSLSSLSHLNHDQQLDCTVVIASRSPAKCAETVEHLRLACPTSKGTLLALPLDTCDLTLVAAFVQSVQQRFPQGLHYLVNNAGK